MQSQMSNTEVFYKVVIPYIHIYYFRKLPSICSHRCRFCLTRNCLISLPLQNIFPNVTYFCLFKLLRSESYFAEQNEIGRPNRHERPKDFSMFLSSNVLSRSLTILLTIILSLFNADSLI